MLPKVIEPLGRKASGAQFGTLLKGVPEGTLGDVVRTGVVIGVVSIVVRLLWVPLATYLPRWLSRDLHRRDPVPSPKSIFLVAWTSMRGIVSLASALASPPVYSSNG